MELTLLKVDTVKRLARHQGKHLITIPPGGIQFELNKNTFALNETLELVMGHDGDFENILRYLDFVVYVDDESIPRETTYYSLFSILANEYVQKDIHLKIYAEMQVA